MKLQSAIDMGEVAGLCCRQSRLRGAVGALIFSAVLVGVVFFARHWGAPWYFWGAGAVLAGLFVTVLIHAALAKFRATNWVLRAAPDGLWINLRSLQKPATVEAATVVWVSFDEIGHAHRHIDTWTMPYRNRSLSWKLESLDLHLKSENTRDVALALTNERESGKGDSPSVRIPASGVIRIAWRGHGLDHDVVPALDQVLAAMSPRVTVTDTTRTERPNWRKLSEAELDEQIEHLVRWGDQMGAGELLMTRRGCSSTEAHKVVTEVAQRC